MPEGTSGCEGGHGRILNERNDQRGKLWLWLLVAWPVRAAAWNFTERRYVLACTPI
jgi:hypothetical protein